jgi:hypothetical protein
VLKLKDGRKKLYQWDIGVIADVVTDGFNEVHFSNLKFGVSFNVEVKDKTVEIPPEILQSGADVFCWAFVRDENSGYTKKEQTFNVEKRPRPADYVYTPTEILSLETLKAEIEKPITTDRIANDAVTVDKVTLDFADKLLNFLASDDINFKSTQMRPSKQVNVSAYLANKVTEISEKSTHTQIPTAKSVYDLVVSQVGQGSGITEITEDTHIYDLADGIYHIDYTSGATIYYDDVSGDGLQDGLFWVNYSADYGFYNFIAIGRDAVWEVGTFIGETRDLNGSWICTFYKPENASKRANVINDTTNTREHYPSVKLMVDYVNELIGGIENGSY